MKHTGLYSANSQSCHKKAQNCFEYVPFYTFSKEEEVSKSNGESKAGKLYLEEIRFLICCKEDMKSNSKWQLQKRMGCTQYLLLAKKQWLGAMGVIASIICQMSSLDPACLMYIQH